MLSFLHIENIAVIEAADIPFDPGFNVLTGETGAGKSIVIDAISAILGERVYRDMIRTGANKLSVRGIFTDVPALSWFADNGVAHEEETLIQRDVFLDGRNVCRVNGTLVNVSILHQLGIQLINIHGQHDSAQLFDADNHLHYLDLFAADSAELERYQAVYAQVASLSREIARLSMDEGEKLRKMESLQYQIDEITRAALEADEDTRLEARRKLLQNAEKLSVGLNAAVEMLYGGDDSDGAAVMLSQACRALGKIAKFDDSLATLNERITDLMYQVQDAAEELRDTRDSMAYSPDELETIEARLDVIHRLKRKYGSSCAEILEYLSRAQQSLDEITFADDRLERLKKKLDQVQSQAWQEAQLLRERRKAAAAILSARIQQELSQLDMPKVRFSCEFTETELGDNGADGVAFYMSANVGEALKPLNKVASGGELSRIMLAMKNVMAEQDEVATLIFDEVDTGVSGRAAQKVAEKLRSVAKYKQVLCVTHLPQLAALADTHFLIAKGEQNGRTYTTVTPLSPQERKTELARIIGGAAITETTLKNAEEMLQSNH